MCIKNLLTAALLLALCATAAAQTKQAPVIVIEGTIIGDRGGDDKVYCYTGHEDMDSTIIKNDHYSFTLPFKKPVYVIVTPQYIMKGGWRPFGVLADKPGKYSISSETTKPFTESIVTGSAATAAFVAYGSLQRQVRDKIWAIVKKIDLKGKDEETSRKVYDSLSAIYWRPKMEDFIREHSDSYAAVYILASEGRYALSMDEQEKMYHLLSPAMKNTEAGKGFYAGIEGTKNSAIGNTVADFSLPDPSGKSFSFSSLKGRYRMVDFWASWCVPCRQSFPLMRKLYAACKGPQFEMLSISIDKSAAAWQKALKEEKNPWPQTLDNKDIAASHFGITAVPTIFLIDPDGKILARQEGFDEEGNGAVEKKMRALGLLRDAQGAGR